MVEQECDGDGVVIPQLEYFSGTPVGLSRWDWPAARKPANIFMGLHEPAEIFYGDSVVLHDALLHSGPVLLWDWLWVWFEFRGSHECVELLRANILICRLHVHVMIYHSPYNHFQLRQSR